MSRLMVMNQGIITKRTNGLSYMIKIRLSKKSKIPEAMENPEGQYPQILDQVRQVVRQIDYLKYFGMVRYIDNLAMFFGYKRNPVDLDTVDQARLAEDLQTAFLDANINIREDPPRTMAGDDLI